MGIDHHSLQFLRYAAKRRQLGLTCTIGRQGLHIREQQLRNMLGLPREYEHEQYCDNLLLKYFNATHVESFDNSDYEGATHIVDMNKPLGSDYPSYDTIIDFGCLEHVYNVSQALTNLSQLCGEGGQILHVLPANNYCGHGFWQFSPELMFSLYSKENGYTDTQVFIADISQETVWYEVIRPKNGERAEVTSPTPLYLLCRTVKGAAFSHDNVQQSDYVHVWDQHGNGDGESGAKRTLWAKRIYSALSGTKLDRALYRLIDSNRMRGRLKSSAALSAKNRHLIERRVSSLL